MTSPAPGDAGLWQILDSFPGLAARWPDLPVRRGISVRAPDGLRIAVQDWSVDNKALPVLFVHGFSQSHVCWLPQVASPLARAFRLVSYDNRGHGLSDKPTDPLCYRTPEFWADEVDAVIRNLDLRKPVLAVWSYGGRIALDYIRRHGDAALSGLVMIAATASAAPEYRGPAAPLLAEMGHQEEQFSDAAVRKFLAACTHQPLPRDETALLLQANQQTPAYVRRALAGRPAEYDSVLQSLRIPVLAIHGSEDRVILPEMALYTTAKVHHGTAKIYMGVGHMPFWEAADRFNTDLAEFAASCANSN